MFPWLFLGALGVKCPRIGINLARVGNPSFSYSKSKKIKCRDPNLPRFPAGHRALPKADPANSARVQQGFGVKKIWGK